MMLLKTLLEKTDVLKVDGPTDKEVASLAYDSRRVTKGALFIALPGQKEDGNSFIHDAILKGAETVVTDKDFTSNRVTVVKVADSRKTLADLAGAFHRFPSNRLKLVAVTGTNGKTTTTFLLKHLLEKAGLRTGLIGTVRYEIGDRLLPASRTTPESLEMNEMLAQVVASGGSAAVLEASSHALVQDRLRGLEFNAAIFTNLTQDHLDYHRTMSAYFDAKALLFEQVSQQTRKKGVAVINIDSPQGVQLAKRFAETIPVTTYGVSSGADFQAGDFTSESGVTRYQLAAKGKNYLVRMPLIGRFNISNSLAALAAASALGVNLRDSVLALASVPQIPGRLQAVPMKRQFQVYVDYAHTDDALLNVLKTLRELHPARLIVVFGCGGNRDKMKRHKMGSVAEQYADYAIITSDNPRKEDPAAIMADITQGMHSSRYEMCEDRQVAIFKSVSMARPKDIILIAGKGHETYQEFADHTVPFNDVEIVQMALTAQPVKLTD